MPPMGALREKEALQNFPFQEDETVDLNEMFGRELSPSTIANAFRQIA